VDGTLEKATFARNKQQTGSNSTGTPRFTEKQRAFAAHPEVTTNWRKAALESGYSQSFAKTQAIALRKQLAPLIMEYQERAKQLSAISTARIQTELASMGFANVLDYFDVSPDGSVKPKMLHELTREQAAAIQEVEVIAFEIEGEPTTYRIGRIKLADKRANLVELGKTLGMFNKIVVEDKREGTLLMRDIPNDALEAAEQMLLGAAADAKEQREKNDAIPGEFKELPSPDGDTNVKT